MHRCKTFNFTIAGCKMYLDVMRFVALMNTWSWIWTNDTIINTEFATLAVQRNTHWNGRMGERTVQLIIVSAFVYFSPSINWPTCNLLLKLIAVHRLVSVSVCVEGKHQKFVTLIHSWYCCAHFYAIKFAHLLVALLLNIYIYLLTTFCFFASPCQPNHLNLCGKRSPSLKLQLKSLTNSISHVRTLFFFPLVLTALCAILARFPPFLAHTIGKIYWAARVYNVKMGAKSRPSVDFILGPTTLFLMRSHSIAIQSQSRSFLSQNKIPYTITYIERYTYRNE